MSTYEVQDKSSKRIARRVILTSVTYTLLVFDSFLSAFFRRRLWELNKDDWAWVLLGILGAIIAGATTPTEGVFIAHVQVKCPYIPSPLLKRQIVDKVMVLRSIHYSGKSL